MKIRITTGAIPGIAEGAILDATPNGWYTETRPRWFVNGKGIYAYEAEEVQEGPDYEDEEDQSAPLPVLQTENDSGMVAPARGSDSNMDVQLLPAQPARATTEDAERLVNLLYRIASANTTHGDAEWLRDRLTAWLNIMVARGEKLDYENANDDQPIIDALDEMQL